MALEEQFPGYKDSILSAREQGLDDAAIRSTIQDKIKSAIDRGVSTEKISEFLYGKQEEPSITDDLLGRSIRTIDVPRQVLLSYSAGDEHPIDRALEQVSDEKKIVTGDEIRKRQLAGTFLADRNDPTGVLLGSILELADPSLLIGTNPLTAVKNVGKGIAGSVKTIINRAKSTGTMAEEAAKLTKEGAIFKPETGTIEKTVLAQEMEQQLQAQDQLRQSYSSAVGLKNALAAEEKLYPFGKKASLEAELSIKNRNRELIQNQIDYIDNERARIIRNPDYAQSIKAEQLAILDEEKLKLSNQFYKNQEEGRHIFQEISNTDIEIPKSGKDLAAVTKDAEDTVQKLNSIADKIQFKPNDVVRLEDGTSGYIAGIMGERATVKTSSGIKVFNLDKLKALEIKSAASDATITKTGKVINGKKIKLNKDSGLTEKEAFDELDVPSNDYYIDEIRAAEQLNKIRQENNLTGLGVERGDNVTRLAKISQQSDARLPGMPISEGSAGKGSQGGLKALTPSNRPPTPPNEVPTIYELADNENPVVSNAKLIALRINKPTHKIAGDYEMKTGIPTFSKLYLSGRNTIRQSTEFQLQERNILEKIFKPFAGNTKNKIAAREEITRVLEKIETGETRSATQLARTLNTQSDKVEVALKLRKYYDEKMAQGFIGADQFLPFYSPRLGLKSETDRFNFIKNSRFDNMAFFQHRRTGGELLPLEEDAFKLANRYVGAAAQAKWLVPWEQNVAFPIVGGEIIREGKRIKIPSLIQNDTAREFFDNYRMTLRSLPNRLTVNQNDGLTTILENIAKRRPALGNAIDWFISRYGDDRIAEVLSSKYSAFQYRNALDLRPIAALRNATQRLMGVSLIGETKLARGQYISLFGGEEEKLRALRSGTLGAPGDILEAGSRVEKLTAPLGIYQALDDGGRRAIWWPVQHDVDKAFNAGKSFEQVAKQENLQYYPDYMAKHFEKLYRAGMVGDVLKTGPVNNAANFLGDMAQLLSQLPYELGGGIEFFRRSPLHRQLGVFNTWALLVTDFLGNLVKTNAKELYNHPIHELTKGGSLFWRTARMLTYFTALDYTAKNMLGFSLMSNPVLSFPSKVTSPIVSGVGSAIAAISNFNQEWYKEFINDVTSGYAELAKEQNNSAFWNSLDVLAIPRGVALKEAYKTITDSKNSPAKDLKESIFGK
jgi:hypothetical protein